jgi:uncharacterized protein YjlB
MRRAASQRVPPSRAKGFTDWSELSEILAVIDHGMRWERLGRPVGIALLSVSPDRGLRSPHQDVREPRPTKELDPIAVSSYLLFAHSPFRRSLAQGSKMKQPETALFEDDSVIPNNRLRLLLYRAVLPVAGNNPATGVMQLFAANDWTNSWQNGIYPFHHYHSTSHEVLGVYRGSAKVRLGGEQGEDFDVRAGDVIVIPAGVGHKNLGASDDFGVVGAYPDGRRWDLLTGKPGERPQADRNIAALPVPDNDPVYGAEGPLREIWGA